MGNGCSSETSIVEEGPCVAYQGCAEDAICYPPIKKTIHVETAMLEAPAAPGPGSVGTAAPSRGSADEIALKLAGGSLLAVAGTFFVRLGKSGNIAICLSQETEEW